MIPRIKLKPGREASVLRSHPWIFSGAIRTVEGDPAEGDVVEVLSSAGEYLATGHFQQGTIAVKILSFRRTAVNQPFFTEAICNAHHLRRSAGLTENSMTNAYRLVFSEGDLLPGLVIDWYNGVAVVQPQSAGMLNSSGWITEALKTVYGPALRAVYLKNTQSVGYNQQPATPPAPSHEGRITAGTGDRFLYGFSDPVEIVETGHRFRVDFIRGQKTGFYLDQRSNRMFAQFYARGRKVLNAFSYTGAFSVYALKGGATSVHSIDSSEAAIGQVQEHIRINGIMEDRHRGVVADVLDFLPGTGEYYDLVILDPPAFAKSHRVTHNALQAYIHINAEALKRLTPGGILFTFSCSQAISREVFRSAVLSAAMETGRTVRILHHLSQGPDHPVSLFHPEGEYLKGLILVAE